IIVMANNCVKHFLAGLAVAASKLSADLGMTALHFVVCRLSDVMEQPAATCKLAVQAELGRHEAAEMGNFQTVLQHVLAVARPELESPQKLHKLLVDRIDAAVEHCLFADLEDVFLHLLLSLFNHFFNTRGMDATILDQLRECQPRDFAANI